MNRIILFTTFIALLSIQNIFSDQLSDALLKISTLEKEKKALQDSNDKLKKAIDDSNNSLQNSINKINSLEKDVADKDAKIKKADKALEENNIVLINANNRIDEDQIEIVKLRNVIKDLINSGVEISTYHWEIVFTGGYPTNLGLLVSYNIHFFPRVGLLLGFMYDVDGKKPFITAGLKINIK